MSRTCDNEDWVLQKKMMSYMTPIMVWDAHHDTYTTPINVSDNPIPVTDWSSDEELEEVQTDCIFCKALLPVNTPPVIMYEPLSNLIHNGGMGAQFYHKYSGYKSKITDFPIEEYLKGRISAVKLFDPHGLAQDSAEKILRYYGYPIMDIPSCEYCGVLASAPNNIHEYYCPISELNNYGGLRVTQYKKLRSQKAKGLSQNLVTVVDNLEGSVRIVEYFIIPERKYLSVFVANTIDMSQTLFFRPCPTTPQHGFVDSFKVDLCNYSREQLQNLLENVWDKMTALDPDAELIFGQYVDTPTNAIFLADSGRLDIGPGHDGATGGSALSVSIPVIPWVMSDELKALFAITEATFMELVSSRHNLEVSYAGGGGEFINGTIQSYKSVITQMRSGPAVASGILEFIPKATVVQQVVTPSDDLIEWMNTAKELAGQPGVVAWMPGANLGCHQAIHCVKADIPFLTRKDKPAIGSLIMPPEGLVEVPFDKQSFKNGVLASRHSTPFAGVPTAIAILHNQAALVSYPERWYLTGYAISMLCRASAIACLGELRHYRGPVYSSDGTKARNRGILRRGHNRQTIYYHYNSWLLSDVIAELAPKVCRFADAEWESGFGGLPWFGAAVRTVELYNRISELDIPQSLELANRLLNMAHNGGWLLNKFWDARFMNLAAEYPGLAMALCHTDLFRILNVSLNSEEDKQFRVRRKRVAGPVELTPTTTMRAYITAGVSDRPRTVAYHFCPSPMDVDSMLTFIRHVTIYCKEV